MGHNCCSETPLEMLCMLALIAWLSTMWRGFMIHDSGSVSFCYDHLEVGYDFWRAIMIRKRNACHEPWWILDAKYTLSLSDCAKSLENRVQLFFMLSMHLSCFSAPKFTPNALWWTLHWARIDTMRHSFALHEHTCTSILQRNTVALMNDASQAGAKRKAYWWRL